MKLDFGLLFLKGAVLTTKKKNPEKDGPNKRESETKRKIAMGNAKRPKVCNGEIEGGKTVQFLFVRVRNKKIKREISTERTFFQKIFLFRRKENYLHSATTNGVNAEKKLFWGRDICFLYFLRCSLKRKDFRLPLSRRDVPFLQLKLVRKKGETANGTLSIDIKNVSSYGQEIIVRVCVCVVQIKKKIVLP